MDRFTRILLSPLALIYGLAISVRNALYESKLLKSTSFNIPVISIGNLNVGGTGKTPTVEWLLEKLGTYLNVAVLSRGYGRNSKGYRKVIGNESAKVAGDESLQIKRKYPFVAVAVSESRTIGLTSLLTDYPETQVVLLDDAFQHRSILPGLSFLLTEYSNPYYQDQILPAGTLREWRSAASRGDYLIVTKCPENLTLDLAELMKEKFDAFPPERIFFQSIKYPLCYSMHDYQKQLYYNDYDAILVVTAIATPEYLQNYVDERVENIYTYDFSDHHYYTSSDLENVINSYNRIPFERKAVVTTEKDIVKLLDHRNKLDSSGMEIFIQRMSTQILFNQEILLEKIIKEFLLNFRR
jgi:tetraacyldisaccharide 4'-kinase